MEAGLKTGTAESPGGWRCYITNLIKAAEYAGKRKEKKSKGAKRADAETWAPVLRWQLAEARPGRLVIMGGSVADLVMYLVKTKQLALPLQVHRIDSYVYVSSHPAGKLGPMNEQRVREYKQRIAEIAAQAGIAPGV